MKAIWNNTVIADSEDTVLVEGNHYFPETALNRAFTSFSNHKTSCAWKGQAIVDAWPGDTTRDTRTLLGGDF